MVKMQAPAFEVIEGGKDPEFPITKADPKPPNTEDWLRTLPEHTRFVSQHKTNQGSRLDTYGIAAILDIAVLLYDFNNPMGPPMFYVLSERFSKDNRFVGILPEPKGENDGEHHPPEPEPREVDD